MKKARRILSMLLAVLMIISSAVVTIGAEEATVAETVDPATEDHGTQPTTWWTDNAATGFAGGDGSEANPFQIATPAQMAYFANYLEGGALDASTSSTVKYFSITADIDLSAHQWKPIGDSADSATFSDNTLNYAVLDGGNHTVSGVKLTAGSSYTYKNGCALFATANNSTIKNLNLEVKILDPILANAGFPVAVNTGASISNAQAGVASLIAAAYGTCAVNNVTVELDLDSRNVGSRVANSSNVYEGYVYAGLVAITGLATNGTVLTDCTVNGSMYVDVYGNFNTGSNGLTTSNQTSAIVAGVLGYYQASGLYNVTNNADITVIASQGNTYVGGILGKSFNGLTGKNIKNTGDIEVTTATGGFSYIGGVMGTFASCSFVEGPVTNEGDVTVYSYNTAVYTGGMVGQASNAATVMDGWTNKGTVTFVKSSHPFNNSYVGGIAGSTGTAGITIKNSANEGEIIYQSNSGYAAAYVAGIVGYDSKGVTVTSCVNKNDISIEVTGSTAGTNVYAAGLVARQTSTGSISDCVNYGDVSFNAEVGSTSEIGGIVGYTNTNGGSISNCVNYGDVTNWAPNGAHYTGGIAGHVIASANGTTIENCQNYGDVTNSDTNGNNAAAGVVGRTGNGDATGTFVAFKNCITVGAVSQSSLSGGVVGYTAAASASKKTDSSDFDKDGSTTDEVYVVRYPYTVTFENCLSLKSGTTYAIVGSNRASVTTFKNCFGDTEYPISYYNQNSGNYYTDGTHELLSIDGVTVTGNNVRYSPASTATVSLATLDGAGLRIDSDATEESGIRFDSYMTRETYDELTAVEGITFDFGTIIAPTDYLNHYTVAYEYDKIAALDALAGENGKTYVLVPYAQDFLSSSDGSYCYFAAALNNIKEDNYELKYSAVAYLNIVSDGEVLFTVYSDYDFDNEERAASPADVATTEFENRATEKTVIGGEVYQFLAHEENACYLGDYSIYSNTQLALLKLWSSYDNEGKEVPAGLTVNGVSIEEYKIVYAQSPIYSNYGSMTGKTLYGDLGNVTMTQVESLGGGTVEFGDALLGARYEYDKETAERLRDLILEKYGVELEVVPDYDIGEDAAYTSDDVVTPESPYEILVGFTNRAKSQTIQLVNQSVDEYTFKIDGTKVIVCGGSYGATWHAVDGLEEAFETIEVDEEGNAADYNLKMVGDPHGSYYLQKIATIGDSITRGSQALPDGSAWGLSNGADSMYGSSTVEIYYRNYLSYPANLQRLMWKDAVVYNYGKGASTAGKYSETNTNYYYASTNWADCYATSNSEDVDFDLVFIMHGTNDSGYAGGVSGKSGAYNWTDNDVIYFQSAIKKMIDGILEGSPDAIFVINNIPHRFDTQYNGTDEHNTMAMAAIQKTVATNLRAQGYNVYHYDMNSYTRENLCVEECEDCYTAEDAANGGIDSTSEVAAHGYYYNTNTPFAYDEGTHPNFRGYNKIADGIYEVVDYLLNGAEAPEYMIDISGAAE